MLDDGTWCTPYSILKSPFRFIVLMQAICMRMKKSIFEIYDDKIAI